MEKVNLSEKLSLFSELWSPKVVGEIGDYYIKLAKLKGEFVWHKHDTEDELFFVVKGSLTIRFRERDIVLSPGELLVVPKGVEHMPVAEAEAHVMLFEPKTTVNTGDIRSERTKTELEWI